MDGRRFFYENMLRRAKKLPYELIWGQERAEYILKLLLSSQSGKADGPDERVCLCRG